MKSKLRPPAGPPPVRVNKLPHDRQARIAALQAWSRKMRAALEELRAALDDVDRTLAEALRRE